MLVATWFEDLDDAAASGAIDDSSSIVVLRRNTDVPLESADAWIALPIVSIERDVDDVDLMVGDPSDDGMRVGDLRAWFLQHADCGECELFVPGEWDELGSEWSARHDVPVIGPVLNSSMSVFGAMAWYEQCEDELSR